MFCSEMNLPILALFCAQLNSNEMHSWLLQNLVSESLYVYVGPRPEVQSSNKSSRPLVHGDVVVDLANSRSSESRCCKVYEAQFYGFSPSTGPTAAKAIQSTVLTTCCSLWPCTLDAALIRVTCV